MVKINQELSPAFNKVSLSKKERIAVAAYLEGESLKVIAHEENISVNAVKARLKNAEKRFLKAFGSKNLLGNSLKHGLYIEMTATEISKTEELTQKQKQLLDNIIDKKSYANIAFSQSVSESTLRQRSGRIGKKLGQKSRLGLALQYMAAHIYNDINSEKPKFAYLRTVVEKRL